MSMLVLFQAEHEEWEDIKNVTILAILPTDTPVLNKRKGGKKPKC